jgi:hypothetical protein
MMFQFVPGGFVVVVAGRRGDVFNVRVPRASGK